ncbi:MAG TPA: adenylate/guanylate cyclase domain-containing protein [Jatrophihabitantaceae bacterium]|nr:adenylate/guanylate cyclase domain-containing protein [Jatrophihabitantaceae bacterium]
MATEPVRGRIPDRSLLSLSGLEILRAYMRGLVASTPMIRLFGSRLTQVSSGTAVVHQVISPWLEINDEFVDLTATAEYVVELTAATGVPPGSHVRVVNVSLRYLRPCTVANEMLIVRGRILHAGSSFTTVEALFEDALGRAVAHCTGSVIVRPMSPPPPPMTSPLEPVDEPSYPTPDPPRRPMDQRPDAADRALPPIGRLIGADLVTADADGVTVEVPASEWFCRLHPEVAPGVVGLLGNLAIRQAALNAIHPAQQFLIIEATTTSMTAVVPDGRPLRAVATVRQRRDDVLQVEAEVSDADGQTVAIVQGPCLVRDRFRPTQTRPSMRKLLTVLFTDLVDSTERAQELGDAGWGALLDKHNAAIRKQLATYSGREVKTTGDGVLATFESPTQAVRCAQTIRDSVEQLGLRIRAGVHTGDCEIVGHDVAGLAVHIASRIQAAAQPGEILVSSTVRDLMGACDIRLQDRGEVPLRGIDRPWTLFAVED